MADKKTKKNVFQRFAQKVIEIRQELKRVIWPTRQKLKQISAVVLVVIAISAIVLTFISKGGQFVLEKIGFYQQVTIETTIPTTASQPLETSADTNASSESVTASENAPSGETTESASITETT